MARILVIATLAGVVGGCSAEIKVSELDPRAPHGTVVNGVPFRTKERYIVKVYRKSPNGYEEVARDLQTLPNPDKLYVLQHIGQAFANTNTKFVLQTDGTLDAVDLGADSQLDEALTALGEQVAAAGDQIEAIRTAREGEQAAEETERQAEEAADIEYQTALNAATLAEAQLAELPPDSTASTVLAKANEVRLLKLKANVAARRAGLPRPFPDVSL